MVPKHNGSNKSDCSGRFPVCVERMRAGFATSIFPGLLALLEKHQAQLTQQSKLMLFNMLKETPERQRPTHSLSFLEKVQIARVFGAPKDIVLLTAVLFYCAAMHHRIWRQED